MPKKIDPALRERAVRLGMARESVRRWVTQAYIDDRLAEDNLGGVGGDQATDGGDRRLRGRRHPQGGDGFLRRGASSPQR